MSADKQPAESVVLLRGKFFNEGNFHVSSDVINLGGEEIPIEIRTPTVSSGNRIVDMATVKKGEQPTAEQVFKMRASALIECIRDPATHERIFNDRDMNRFRDDAPAGIEGWFQVLGDRCLKLLKGNVATVCKMKTGEKIPDPEKPGVFIEAVCGADIPPDGKFCPMCGKPAPDPVEETKKN